MPLAPILPPNAHTVVATLHPAFAMRGLSQLKGSIRTAIGRARTWSFRNSPPERGFNFYPNPTPNALADALAATSRFVVDVETPRDAHKRITLCGVATATDSAFVVKWEEPYISIIKAALESPTRTKLGHNLSFDAQAFRAYDITLAWPIGDTIEAASLLWPPQPKSKQDERAGKVTAKMKTLSLAACALRVFDNVAYWKEVDRNPQVEALYSAAWPQIPRGLYPWLYCANDCIITFRLWVALSELLKQEGLFELFTTIVAPASVVLHKMEHTGILLDVDRRDMLREECRTTIARADAKVKELIATIHEKRINTIQTKLNEITTRRTQAEFDAPAACAAHPEYKGLTKRQKCETCKSVYEGAATLRESIKQLAQRESLGKRTLKKVNTQFAKLSDDYWRWVLFDPQALNLRSVSKTKKKKQPQVSDDVMEALLRKNPDNELLKLRVELKHSTSRLKSRLGVEPEEDGRVHFVISQHKTGTGRFASGTDDVEADKIRKSPGNAQNIPDKDRRMYIAAPGHNFVQVDWSQIEARVVAWCANERAMLEAFAQGKDIHSLSTAAIFGCAPNDANTTVVYFEGEHRIARDAAKRGTHGLNYYMLIAGLIHTFGLTFEEAAKVFSGYHAAWPDLMPWQKRQIERAVKDGVLVNHFQRKDWFFDKVYDYKAEKWTLKDPGRAVAFVPQSNVADMAKIIMVRLDKLGVPLRTNTHDSFLAEPTEGDTLECARLMQREMECEWPQLGTRTILGAERAFAVPADVAIGKNWMKWHEHTAKCEKPCKREVNSFGVKAVTLTPTAL